MPKQFTKQIVFLGLEVENKPIITTENQSGRPRLALTPPNSSMFSLVKLKGTSELN